ncbi:hypothetical protein [Snuella lapsa]|uniref:Uncharacterized protein n=1 Tax=Snuella lapsa TaxID=870481 RepID=A0ABP6X485_9FLAO
MEQRDLLKDQIEQLGKVLAKILSDFLGLKSKGQGSQKIEITDQRLLSELDIDIKMLADFTKKELKNYFIARKFTANHLEILSDYLNETGKVENALNKEEVKIRLRIAVELLEIADEISNTLSLDRINKKK